MTNPFNDALDWAIQGKLCRVYANHGVYEGWVDKIHHSRGSVVMHGSIDEDGTEYGSTFVRTVEGIDVIKPRKKIEYRDIEGLSPHPDHDIDFEPKDSIIRRCYRNQFAGGFPVVRTDGTIINGHKRIEACKMAGLKQHPVEVVDVSNEQAKELFRVAHRSIEHD